MTGGRRPAGQGALPAGQGALPAGEVERAVAEILASAPRGIPFTSCPECGTRLSDTSFVQEYWVGRETRFMIWCRACRATYTLVPVERYESHEAVE